MLIQHFPPLAAGGSGAPPGAALGELRRAVQAAKRDALTRPQRLAQLAALPLWPLVVLVSSLAWQLPRHGARAWRQSGRNPLLQLADQLRLALTAGMWPHQYYMFELFRPELRAQARSYLLRQETKRGVYSMLKDRPRKNPVFARKDLFADACAAAGLPHGALIARLGNGAADWRGEHQALPPRDLFVKPVRGRGGRGAERWRWDGAAFAGAGKVRLTAAGLLARLFARREACVVMPCLVNHPALSGLALTGLGSGTLATLRIVTCRDERDAPEATAAALRFPRRPDAVVDNFHAGGLAAIVDLATGALGAATDLGLARDSAWHDRHPVSDAPIAGALVPFWREAKHLAERAHTALGDRVVIGWDVAVLADGPVLIEANGFPDLDILQRCGRAPLGPSRLCDLMALHLRRAYPPRLSVVAPPPRLASR